MLGRRPLPNTHESATVRATLALIKGDPRSMADVCEAAGVSRSFATRMKTRSYHVSLPAVEALLYEMGYQLIIIKRPADAERPPYAKTRVTNYKRRHV